jgi:dTDP-4-amino-4,6-dideoxygalactose transaminase
MRVPYNYLPAQFADPEGYFSDWRELIRSTEFTLGPYVEAFERKFATFIGSRHVIGTNTGTDALILALKALGIGAGDEVITVAATFYATAGAIAAVGATPVFVDVDERYQMDPAATVAAITERTRALLPVHWAGASPDMARLAAIARKHGLRVVEDACMGPGGSVQGRHPGTIGDLGCFSMHPLKPLHVMGDGGMVCTDDDRLYAWMKKYRNHGMVDRDHIEFWGVNMRLQPLQAMVASRVLDTVPASVERRNELAARLDTGLRPLAPQVTLPPRPAGYRETYSLYIACCERRDELLAHLRARGVEAKVHYPVPLHLQPAALTLGYRPGSLPRTEWQAARIVTLPLHQFLDQSQVDYMVEAIAAFYCGRP